MTEQIDNLTALYRIRHRIGTARQPHHTQDLESLHTILSEKKLKHPYQITADEHWEALNKACDTFATGAHGQVAELPPDQRFLYRISPLRTLIRFTEWKSRVGLERSVSDLFMRITDDFAGTWLPLSRYARGKLNGHRNMTWWTDMELALGLQSDQVAMAAYRLGLINLWIPEHGIVLRCRADAVRMQNLAHVPTVIDGFVQPIFHPMRSDDEPPYGITISIDTPDTVGPGEHEFVLGPIPVDAIDFYPIYIDHRPHEIDLTSALCDLLEAYYTSLA